MIKKSSKAKIYFNEEQSLRNSLTMWMIYAAFIVDIVISLWGLYQQVGLEKPFGNHPASNAHLEWAFGLTFFVMVVIIVLGMRTSLITIIDGKGIRFRFTLFMKEKFISKEDINRYEVRKYKPILEYGGWGYRKRIRNLPIKKKAGIAYNVKGNMGLQLYLKNGAKILIGTQKPAGMERAMKKLMEEGGIADG